MRHVRPERLAGDLTAEEQQHVIGCATCEAAARRVGAARAAMADVAVAPPPPLNWDLLGARLYWSASSDLRRRERERENRRGWTRRWAPVALVGVAASGLAVGAALFIHARGPSSEALRLRPHDLPVKAAAVAPPESPAQTIIPVELLAAPRLAGVITFLSGQATLDGAPLGPDAEIGPGARLETQRGRVAVQFGDRSGFVLEPGSAVELSAFDERRVELRVTGTIGVDLTKRQEGQRFSVRAGARTVEVRGTVFRVAHDAARGDLDVVVTRGRVAVSEDGGAARVEVPAGQRLSLPASARLPEATARPILAADAAALAASLRVPLIEAPWTTAGGARAQSAVLTLVAAPRATVRVDGVEVGTGRVVVRAAPGRHLVEAGGTARWLSVRAGEAPEAQIGEHIVSERPGQVDAQLEAHRPAIERCGAAARKLDPSFAGQLRMEMGIDADGSVTFVAPVQGIGDTEVEACILDLIRDRFTFPVGTKATVQKVIRF